MVPAARGAEAADAAAPSSELVDAWFRVQWSSPQPVVWRVRLDVEAAEPGAAASCSIVAFENHCTADVSTGAFTWGAGRRGLAFHTPEKLTGGAARIHLRGTRTSLLNCRLIPLLADAPTVSPPSVQVRLGELVQAAVPYQHTVAATATTPEVEWTIQRTGGDALRVTLQESTSMYRAGETIPFSLGIRDLVAQASNDVTLRYQLRRTSDGEVVASESWDVTLDAVGTTPPVEVVIAAPDRSGVYELRGIVETRDSRVWSPFRRRKDIIIEAGRAIVVAGVDAGIDQPVTGIGRAWRTLPTIHPSQSRQWTIEGFVPATTNALLSTIHLASEPSLGQQVHAGEVVSELDAAASCEFKLPVDRPHMPHIVTLRYPAAAGARLRIDVSADRQPLRPQLSFAVAEDTAQIDRSTWASHAFVYYPGDRHQTIRLTNLDAVHPVLLHSIQVTSGPDRLTPVGKGNEADASVAALSLPNFGWVEQLTPEWDTRHELAEYFPETKSLYRLRVASLRLADYVRAAGMNGVVVPANQGGRTWFETTQFSRRFAEPGEPAQQLDMVMDVLGSAGLRVLVGLKPTMKLTAVEAAIRANTQGTAPQLRGQRHNADQRLYQPLDPTVERSILGLIEDLTATCRRHACFAGLSLDCEGDSHLSPLDGGVDLGSETLERFVQTLDPASVPTVPVDRWRHSEGRELFLPWLLGEQRQVFDRIGTLAQTQVLLRLPSGAVEWWGDQGLCTGQWPDTASGLYPVVEHRRGSLGSLSDQRAAARHLNSLAAREPAHSRPLALALSECNAADGTPTAVIHDALDSDLGRLVDRLHPQLVVIDVAAVTGSLSPQLAVGLRALAQVPLGQLQRVVATDMAAQPLRLYRAEESEGALLAINAAPWASELEIRSDRAVRWQLHRDPHQLPAAAFGHAMAESDREGNGGSRLHLHAGAIELVRAAERQGGRVADWTSRPAGGALGLERIKIAVTRIVESLGTFSDARDYPVLSNSGFEQPAEVGGVPGWLTAQYPSGAVRLEPEAADGKWSVALTTGISANARTWLVSETFDVPASGRLAVALAVRGEMEPVDVRAGATSEMESSPGRLRVAIEGTRRGEPVRYAAEVEVPHDGRWRPRRVVLEVDALEAGQTQALRLAIDSLSPGKVWVDDVHLYDWFPLESERNELQGQSFLAVQGLQRGNLAPAARLIRNDWARYLLTLGPAVEPPSKGTPSTAPERPPGMAERIRSWLPRPIRF